MSRAVRAAIAACAGGLALLAAAVGAPGCGTNAVGVETCRAIETARCINAPSCGVDLSHPVHRGAPGSDIDACISYYHDQCLHGLEATTDPGSVATDACVAAINTGTCDVLLHPEHDPACAFLTTTVVDSGIDTGIDAGDGAGFACPTGCVDFGINFCGTGHLCACTAAFSAVPTGCVASSTTLSAGYSAGYCCQ